MKRLVKILSLLLALITCFTLVSCEEDEIPHRNPKYEQYRNFYPDGYTCGFPYSHSAYRSGIEIWWIETYDELIEAIDLLKSHGSQFRKTTFFTYEGELFDTKYCITIYNTGDYTDDIQFGDNPYDRKACVEIASYAFLEDVTIDEINYGDVRGYYIYTINHKYSEKPDNPILSHYSFDSCRSYSSDFIHTRISYEDEKLFNLALGCKDKNDKEPMSDEAIWVLIESLKTINREGEIK